MEGKYNEWVESFGVRPLEPVNSVHGKFEALDSEEYRIVTTARAVHRGYPARNVSTSNPHSVENIKKWIYINRPDFELLSEEFKGSSKSLKFLHRPCGNVLSVTWKRFKNGWPCSHCKKAGAK